MPDAMRIRVKRGGGGVKSQVIDDAVLNYNKIEANTTPRSNEGMYILAIILKNAGWKLFVSK